MWVKPSTKSHSATVCQWLSKPSSAPWGASATRGGRSAHSCCAPRRPSSPVKARASVRCHNRRPPLPRLVVPAPTGAARVSATRARGQAALLPQPAREGPLRAEARRLLDDQLPEVCTGGGVRGPRIRGGQGSSTPTRLPYQRRRERRRTRTRSRSPRAPWAARAPAPCTASAPSQSTGGPSLPARTKKGIQVGSAKRPGQEEEEAPIPGP